MHESSAKRACKRSSDGSLPFASAATWAAISSSSRALRREPPADERPVPDCREGPASSAAALADVPAPSFISRCAEPGCVPAPPLPLGAAVVVFVPAADVPAAAFCGAAACGPVLAAAAGAGAPCPACILLSACCFSRFSSSFSAVFLNLTCCTSRCRRRAMVVRRLRAGVAPSNTNTGRTLWNNSLRGRGASCVIFLTSTYVRSGFSYLLSATWIEPAADFA